MIGRGSETALWQSHFRNEWCILNLFTFLGLEIKLSLAKFLLVSSPDSNINHFYDSFAQLPILIILLDVAAFLIQNIS